jgi:hypothetical protein
MPRAWPAARKFPRKTLGDGVTTARYDPHTFLMWHRKASLRPAQRFGLKAYDSQNHRKTGALVIDLEACDAPLDLIAAFHEKVHWIQYCATSIGCLLTAIRLYQHLWVRLELPEVPARIRAQLFDWRRSGRSIFMIDENNAVIRNHLSENGREFAETWWEYQVAFDLLGGDLGSAELKGHDLPTVLGRVLGFVAHSALGLKAPDTEALFALMAAFGTAQWNNLDTAECGLTTRDLFEAGAVLHELTALAMSRIIGIDDVEILGRLRERETQIGRHPYFEAVRIFCRYAGIDNPQRVVLADPLRRAFHAVVDLALNPPVPPFVSFELLDQVLKRPGGAFSMKQLYPPLRFHTLCGGIKALGKGACPADDAQTAEFERKLCSLTGVIVPPRWSEGPWPGWQAFDLPALEDDQKALERLRLIDYFCAVHKELWQLRRSHAGFSSGYLEAVDLDKDPETSDRLLLERHGAVIQPLHQIGRWLKKGYTMLPTPGLENLQMHLLAKSAFEYLLRDIFGDSGPLSLDGYPPSIRTNQKLQSLLLREYGHWFGDGLEFAAKDKQPRDESDSKAYVKLW